MAVLLHTKIAARRRNYGVAFGLMMAMQFMALATPGGAQPFDKSQYLRDRLAKAPHNSPRLAGNDFYEIFVEDFVGSGVGLYSVRTGPKHPVTLRFGKPQDLLATASQGLTGTSYTTIRSYSSNTDYVQTEFAAPGNDDFRAVWLDALFTDGDSVVADTNFIKPIFEEERLTGYCVLYVLPGLLQASGKQDTLALEQIIQAHGQTFDEAWVEVTTRVINLGTKKVDLGIRYLWDLNVGNDDGPILKQRGGDDFSPFEQSLPADFAYYEAAANDTLTGTNGNIILPPAYNFFGSVLTPATLIRVKQQPDLIQQVFWPQAFFAAFDYAVDQSLRVIGGQNDPLSRLTGGDDAIQYFWGRNPAPAITVWPNDTLTVTQGLFGSLPGQPPSTVVDWVPPSCDITAIRPGPPKTIEVVVQDRGSGLADIRIRDEGNVRIDIPDFRTGALAPVTVVATALNDTEPFHFTISIRDLAGNVMECDPILLTLRPDVRPGDYHLTPVHADRYFYLDNAGLEQISVDLNGHLFELRTSNVSGKNVFRFPAHGEMTIDLVNYLEPDHNTMTLSFSGPPGSRADLVLADMNMKTTVDLVLELEAVPKQFALAQNLPNPFHGHTLIHFELPELQQPQRIELKIYNLLGQLVHTLVDENLSTATYTVSWDGRDSAGREVAAGVYVYRLRAGLQQLTKKMAVLR